jgi:hypothetical protein
MTIVNPQSTPPKITTQRLDLNSDTIVIWTNTVFNYNFSSDKQPILGIELEYFGKKITKEGSTGYFEINPTGQSYGIYKLKLNLYTRSGTGSLADNMGAEAYVFTKEWTLILKKPADPVALITGTTIENGFLKVHWKKCEEPSFQSYEIIVRDSGVYDNYSRKYYNAGITSLTDSIFVGGKVEFTLLVNYKTSDFVSHTVSCNYVYRFPVTLRFRETSDSLTISWRNIPFYHTSFINYNINMGQDSSFTILSPGMCTPLPYTLVIKPVFTRDWYAHDYTIMDYHGLGVQSNMEFSSIVYYPEVDAFYSKYLSHLRKNDGNTFEYLANFDYPWDNFAPFALSPDKSKIFTAIEQDIVQLSDDQFKVLHRDKFSPGTIEGESFYMMQVINDSLMFVSYNSVLSIYDYIHKIIITSVSINYSGSEPFTTSISRSGNYIANCGQGKLSIFRVDPGNVINKIYETTGNFLQCIFDPAKNENLLVVTLDRNYILHCPEMDVLSVLPDRVKGMAVNFDPVTNNLLFVSQEYNSITVYNYEQDSIYFKCRHNASYRDFYLARDNIFFGHGYYVNIKSNE